MDNHGLKISTKLRSLFFIGALFVFLPSIPSHANDPSFLPLGTSTIQGSPNKRKYPRLYQGTNRVNFPVQGSSLPGLLSKNLTTACSLGKFNQKKNKKYYVIVQMPNGSKKKLGFADYTGINLSDPDNRKKPSEAYLFEDDATSQCKVYAAAADW